MDHPGGGALRVDTGIASSRGSQKALITKTQKGKAVTLRKWRPPAREKK